MPFKWKKTWPTTCALKATPFAAELEEIMRVVVIRRSQVFEPTTAIPSNCRGHSPLFFRIRLDRQNACRGSRRPACSPPWPRRRRKRILNNKTCVSMDLKLIRRAQIDVGSGFAAFNFFASNNDLEESGQLMSI